MTAAEEALSLLRHVNDYRRWVARLVATGNTMLHEIQLDEFDRRRGFDRRNTEDYGKPVPMEGDPEPEDERDP